MAGEATADDAGETIVIVRRPWWQSVLRWLAIVLAGLLALLTLVYVVLDTAPGHRFIVSQLARYTTETGLNIKVGRIRGSIYGRMELLDLRVSDPNGVFVTSPSATLDWNPFRFFGNHIDINELSAQTVTMTRAPALKPGDPNAPILPDINVDIGKLRVDRLVLAKSVTGDPHLIRFDGSVHIAERRAQIVANADALRGPGILGGDKLRLRLDAVPDKDRLGINVVLDAPGDGVVAAMSGVKASLQVRIGGQGDWKSWRGKGLATLGGQSLANLDLGAQNGRFTIRGLTHPGLYMAGPVERLTAGGMMVDIDSTLDQRKANTRMTLTSQALAVAANGLIDLGTNSFGNFTLDARLLTPGAMLPNLAGRDVALHLALDGPFVTPTVGYSLTAAVLSFNGTGVEGLSASGKATVDADHVMVPINARARRVTGLNAATGGLLDNVSIGGSLAYSKGKLLSDNLRIKSDRIDATAIVVADLPSGRYTGALKGRVNDYVIDGVGIVDLTTNAKLVTEPRGGFGIKGHVVAKTRRIFSDGVQNFLGGQALVSSDVGYDTNGVITFQNLKLTAPQFSIYRGGGRYLPNGTLAVTADGYSKAYGPITARVTGSAAAPVIVVNAPRPGVGIGLANLQATIRGNADGYAIVAKGGTDYGPFGANVLLKVGKTMTVEVRQGTQVAGVNLLGTLQQTAAGPFAGKLAFSGSGVNGTATLAAQGDVQRADIAAHAYNARIPGAADFTIGRAIATATVILYPNAPRVLGDVQVANLRYGDTVVTSARAKIDYANGAGTAQAVANGSSGVPFNLAMNARLSPRQWLVALQGKANGIAFHTASPARIEPLAGEYRLNPTQIVFDKGSARIAGTFGRTTAIQARLDQLDLSIVSAFSNGLYIDGAATGSVDYVQSPTATVPDVDARLTITGFTRSSASVVSQPVDIVLLARLTAAGGDARALVKRGANTVGRFQATLAPLGAGASLTDRLYASPLTGGVRYNGPAGVLFSLAGLANQQASGGIAVAADFSGTLGSPHFSGIVRADDLTYINTAFGTKLTNMQIAGRFTDDRLELTQLHARAGKGTVDAHGSIGLAADSGFPIDLQASFNNAALADSDALAASATGTISVTNGANGGLIKGDILIPDARYEVVYQGQGEVPELKGVRRKSDLPRPHTVPAPPSNFKLDLHVHAPNQLFVSGMGLESEWGIDLRVGGTTAAPTVYGRADEVRGTYSFAGKRFDLARGVIRFSGNALSDPDLDIEATTDTNGITAVIDIAGTGQHPQITFTSTPQLPQDEVLSRLLFGSSPENLSATEAIQLAAALNSLRGSGGGVNPLGKLRGAVGIDRLRILGADDATGRGTALAAGKYITRNIYIEIITDARGFTATQLEISLTKSLSVLSQMSSFGGSGASVKYQKNF
ncbi:MAG: translocation/assembly module TamB domain-containing protein [Sphingomonas sp.]|uniref:translocation/assembly module TamB domain-containing protein n=1 Tax=Sphingomonas sp. TaxID=28214 RepID=UPI001AD2B71D|nr:translocation/assembly module TamB domain-containing protein [Sphingomonas sp.]MBN8807748.1 translocation/assembly module TamB domain-containing protein [Sphingomonas sp.]